jgi:hypothetical protein
LFIFWWILEPLERFLARKKVSMSRLMQKRERDRERERERVSEEKTVYKSIQG